MPATTAQEHAIARVRAFVPIPKLIKADRIARINGRYIGLKRDKELADALDANVISIAVSDLSQIAKPDKRRITAILGESGAGKTTALFEHTSKLEVMQPYLDAEGNWICPLLAFNAPSPCTPLRFALEGLKALQYEVTTELKEHAAWALFRKVLKSHKVHWVLIDEAQHTIDSANVIERTKIANNFKNLVQMPDWPVRLILAGVEPLGTLLSMKQLSNRKTVVQFEKLRGLKGDRAVAEVLRQIIVEHAGLTTSLDEDLDFIPRLRYACSDDFGTIAQTIRSAVELGIYADDVEITLDHFTRAYASFSGCAEHENIFTAKAYTDLNPYRAVIRDADLVWEKMNLKQRRAAAKLVG